MKNFHTLLHILNLTNHEIHPYLLKKYDLFCFREETLKYIEHWLENIAMYARGAPIVLVGTHKDLVKEHTTHVELSNIISIRLQNGKKSVKKVHTKQKVIFIFLAILHYHICF